MEIVGVDEVELRDFCRARLANFKVPKRFLVRDVLPMLPIGKVDTVALAGEKVVPDLVISLHLVHGKHGAAISARRIRIVSIHPP